MAQRSFSSYVARLIWLSVIPVVLLAVWLVAWIITRETPGPVFQAPLIWTAASLGMALLFATFVGIVGGRLAGRSLNHQLKTLSEDPETTLPSNIKEISAVRELLNANIRNLRESEARHRELFEANPHPMWVFDLETLAFLEVNEAAIRAYGYSQETFQKMTLLDIRPSEDFSPAMDRTRKPCFVMPRRQWTLPRSWGATVTSSTNLK